MALHKHVFASIKQAPTKRQHLGHDYLSMGFRKREATGLTEKARGQTDIRAQGEENNVIYTCVYGVVIREGVRGAMRGRERGW